MLSKNVLNKPIAEKLAIHILALITLGFLVYNFTSGYSTGKVNLASINLKALLMIVIFYPLYIFRKNGISKAGILSAFLLIIPDMLPKYLRDIPTVHVLCSLLIIAGVLYLAIEVMKYVKTISSKNQESQ